MTTNKPMKEDKEEVIYRQVSVKERLPDIPKLAKENKNIHAIRYDGKPIVLVLDKFSIKKEVIRICEYWLEPIPLSSLLSEKDKQIESLELELKQIRQASEINQGVYQQNIQDLKSQLSQSGSKSGYGELLEWVDFQLSLFPTDGYLGAMKDIKEKILSLSSKEERNCCPKCNSTDWTGMGQYRKCNKCNERWTEGQKERSKAGFSEERVKVQKAYDEIWKTQSYPMSMRGKEKADDILKKYFPDLKPDDETYLTPPTSKVEAKPEAGIEAENIGSNYQTAKPPLQEGEKCPDTKEGHNLDVLHLGACTRCGGTHLRPTRNAGSKEAVEARPTRFLKPEDKERADRIFKILKYNLGKKEPSMFELKDAVARKHGYNDWGDLKSKKPDWEMVDKFYEEALNIGITLYANQVK